MRFELSALKYWDDPYPQWAYEPNAIDVAVYIRGDSNGPDPRRVEIVQRTILYIKDLEQRAITYLVEQGLKSRHSMLFENNPTWALESIEFGKPNYDPLDEFAMYFCQGGLKDWDIYGLYHVTFRLNVQQPEQSNPIAWDRENR